MSETSQKEMTGEKMSVTSVSSANPTSAKAISESDIKALPSHDLIVVGEGRQVLPQLWPLSMPVSPMCLFLSATMNWAEF